MTTAVAIGPSRCIYSVQHFAGLSHIVEHTRERATEVYRTADHVRALWVSAAGVIHAAGARHHTHGSGRWLSAPHGGGEVLALWGVDDVVFAGDLDGRMLRMTGGAWEVLGQNDGGMITGVHGTSSAHVVFTGEESMFRWSGTELVAVTPPQPLTQGVYCDGAREWICGSHAVFESGVRRGQLVSAEGNELYGVAVGTAGVFTLGVGIVYEVTSGALVEIPGLAEYTLGQGESYSTSIVGDGATVVAGAGMTVLVNEGAGFTAWPTIDRPPSRQR